MNYTYIFAIIFLVKETTYMWIDTNSIIGITQANTDLSAVLDLVDKYEQAVIFKNNAPIYIVYPARFFKQQQLKEMKNLPFSEVSRNFSLLSYQIYNNVYVSITKYRKPIVVFCDFNHINKMLIEEKIKEEEV